MGGLRGGGGFEGWSGTVWGTLESPQETPWSSSAKRGKIAFVLTHGKFKIWAKAVFLIKKCRQMLSEHCIVTLILYR